MASRVPPRVLDAARAGEGWAFEDVYRTLAPAVHGYLLAQGASDPPGATNDVFLRVFRGLARFEGAPDGFVSWVFTIAHHLVVDERRFAARRPDAAPVADLPDRRAGDAEEDAIDRLARERVVGVLRLLPADQRDVMLLRFVADLSLEQAARATGRSVGAVKALQHRALASLRARLEDLSGEAVSSSPPSTLTTT